MLQAVTLTLEDVESSCLKTASATITTNTSNTSSYNSSGTATAAINIINANLRFQSSPSTSSPLNNSAAVNTINPVIVSSNSANTCSYADCLTNSSNPIVNTISSDNVWKKRNLENSVVIPQETQVKSKFSFVKKQEIELF